MDINEWFEPKDKVHQAAFEHLHSNGTWPNNFVPVDITFSSNWIFTVTYKMYLYYRNLYKKKQYQLELQNIVELYEKWEIDLINCDEAWNTKDGLPKLTSDLYDSLISIQEKRNELLKKIKMVQK